MPGLCHSRTSRECLGGPTPRGPKKSMATCPLLYANNIMAIAELRVCLFLEIFPFATGFCSVTTLPPLG